jgi:hypothetical protein
MWAHLPDGQADAAQRLVADGQYPLATVAKSRA